MVQDNGEAFHYRLESGKGIHRFVHPIDGEL